MPGSHVKRDGNNGNGTDIDGLKKQGLKTIFSRIGYVFALDGQSFNG